MGDKLSFEDIDSIMENEGDEYAIRNFLSEDKMPDEETAQLLADALDGLRYVDVFTDHILNNVEGI